MYNVFITHVAAPQYHARLHVTSYDILDNTLGWKVQIAVDPDTIREKLPTMVLAYWHPTIN